MSGRVAKSGMRISVTGSAGLTTDQIRTYAEYRVFAALARFGRSIRAASVILLGGPGGGVKCIVGVEIDGEHVQCTSTEPHVIGAIDRAADEARRTLDRRARQELSS
jgi:ribosome-associated translation inhibitor RaiA